MRKILLIAISGVSFCTMPVQAQFNTIAKTPERYKVEALQEGIKKPEPTPESMAPAQETSTKPADESKKLWIDRYLSVSYPLQRIRITSPYGYRKDPFTGKRKFHGGIDLHARGEQVLAMSGSITHRAVAEPFVDGREYGVESFVDNGEIHVLAVMQKDMTLPPYYAELGHAIPSGLKEELEIKVKTCVYRAVCALGVNHGSVNMDLLITNGGNVHIIDIGARMGGNLIGSHIVPIGTGIDYMGNMIRAAVSDPTCWKPECQPRTVATKLLALTPGKVKELPDFDLISSKYDVQIEHHLHVGDVITPYRTNLDGCGYVVACGYDVDNCIALATDVRKVIDESIVRE